MKIEWNKVTWYSKLSAVIVFLGTFVLGSYIGMEYQKLQMEKESVIIETVPINKKITPNKPVTVEKTVKQTPVSAPVTTKTPPTDKGELTAINEFFSKDNLNVYMRVFQNNTRTYPTSTAGYQLVSGADPYTFGLVAKNDSIDLKGEGQTEIYSYKDKNHLYTFTNTEIMGDIVERSTVVVN